MNQTLNYAEDKYLLVNNVSIRYRELGQGSQTLLILHGLGASLEHWYRLAPLLAKECKMIILDLPGAGGSDKPKVTYSIEYYVNLLVQFISQLKLKEITLLGHSFGGGLALQIALRQHKAVRQLILLNNAGFSRKVKFLYRLLTIPILNRLLTTLNRNGVRDSLHMNVVDKAVIESDFIDAMHKISQSSGFGHAVRSSVQASSNLLGIKKKIYAEINAKLHELSIPVLVLWGARDPILPFQWQEDSLQKIAHAEVKLIDNAGHLLYLERPNEVRDYIKEFLHQRTLTYPSKPKDSLNVASNGKKNSSTLAK